MGGLSVCCNLRHAVACKAVNLGVCLSIACGGLVYLWGWGFYRTHLGVQPAFRGLNSHPNRPTEPSQRRPKTRVPIRELNMHVARGLPLLRAYRGRRVHAAGV